MREREQLIQQLYEYGCCQCEKCDACKRKQCAQLLQQRIQIGFEYVHQNFYLLMKLCVTLFLMGSFAMLYFLDPYCIHKLFYPYNNNNNNHLDNNNYETLDKDMKASVILMNFARPRNIQESNLMPVLTSHKNVEEVLLLHANPKTIFEYGHEKVRNINATLEDQEMGLAIRFAFCSEVKTPYVIHLDDDIEFPPETLDQLMTEFQKNPKRIVGMTGRSQTLFNSGLWTNSYTIVNAPYETEVVLTRLMIMETDVCRQFVKYSPLLEDLAVQGPGPKWNGEDIFMSLVASHVYEQQQQAQEQNGMTRRPQHYNFAMPWLQYTNVENIYPGSFEYDINGGLRIRDVRNPFNFESWKKFFYMQRNLAFRGHFWKTALERLQSFRD